MSWEKDSKSGCGFTEDSTVSSDDWVTEVTTIPGWNEDNTSSSNSSSFVAESVNMAAFGVEKDVANIGINDYFNKVTKRFNAVVKAFYRPLFVQEAIPFVAGPWTKDTTSVGDWS